MNNVKTVRDALRDGIAAEMRANPLVLLMGEDVAEYGGSYKVTRGLLDEFGSERVIDTPISEMGFAGIGVGASMAGLRPIVEFMTMNFAMQAIDHIISTAAKTRYMSGGTIGCPIVFRGPNSAAARVGAQHSQCFASWYAHIPGLIVIAPYDSNSAEHLMRAAITSEDPVVFLEHELMYGEEFPVLNHKCQIGKAAVLRSGNSVTIVSFSRPLKFCLEAAEDLMKHNIDCEVIDLRTLRPLDMETIIASLRKTGKIIIVEEGWPYAGIASEIMARINEEAWDLLDYQPIRICALDVPLPYADNLEKMCLPSKEKIVTTVMQMISQG